jgi:hypothetical protein
VDAEPLIALVPDQAPEAVQEVALLEDQLNVALPPLETLVGLALSETLGAAADTVTVADCVADPPAPVQVSVYLAVALSADVLIEPAIASDPLQPPEAVHAVVLVEDQFNIDAAPLLTVLGFAVSVTAGAGLVTDTVAD